MSGGFDLKNKVLIITGGGSGIGRKCAFLAADLGASVVIAGRTQEKLDDAVRQAEKRSVRIRAVRADVTVASDCTRVLDAVLSKEGRVDGLVNSTGAWHVGAVHETLEKDWQRVFAANIHSVFLMSRTVLGTMVERKKGAIVHIASSLGLTAIPRNAAYAASKGAVINLTRSMAVDYGPLGIRTNTICPGLTRTLMTEPVFKNPEMLEIETRNYPMGRLGTAEDIARAACFLLSDQASWINGAILPVEGGYLAKSETTG